MQSADMKRCKEASKGNNSTFMKVKVEVLVCTVVLYLNLYICAIPRKDSKAYLKDETSKCGNEITKVSRE